MNATASERSDLAAPPATAAEMGSALTRCDFPLVVWSPSDGVIWLANQAAAELTGLSLAELVNSHIYDFIEPTDAAQALAALLEAGTLNGLQSARDVLRKGLSAIPARLWTRVIELDGQRGAVTLLVPDAEVGRLGRDPSRPWRDLIPVAVGVTDNAWCISGISADVEDVIGLSPRDCIGRRLVDLVLPDDRHLLGASGGRPPTTPTTHRQVRFTNGHGEWTRLCVLLSPAGGDHKESVAFALVGRSDFSHVDPGDRTAELEMHLRRIGAEVRASGVLDNVGTLPSPGGHPQLEELTTRQWEILSLLLKGSRVPSIAKALFISQSTVRNHLTTIFKKFGVHSQPELLDLLRMDGGAGYDLPGPVRARG